MPNYVSTTRSATKTRRRKPEGPLYRDVKTFVDAAEGISLSAAPSWFTQTLRTIWKACGIARRMDAKEAVQRFSDGFQHCRRLLSQLAAKGLTILGAESQSDGTVSIKVALNYRDQLRELEVRALTTAFA